MNLEDELCAGGRGNDIDIGLFPHADAIAGAVNGGALKVSVQGEVIQAAVGEAVPVI